MGSWGLVGLKRGQYLILRLLGILSLHLPADTRAYSWPQIQVRPRFSNLLPKTCDLAGTAALARPRLAPAPAAPEAHRIF
jgi:hypothetical protein